MGTGCVPDNTTKLGINVCKSLQNFWLASQKQTGRIAVVLADHIRNMIFLEKHFQTAGLQKMRIL